MVDALRGANPFGNLFDIIVYVLEEGLQLGPALLYAGCEGGVLEQFPEVDAVVYGPAAGVWLEGVPVEVPDRAGEEDAVAEVDVTAFGMIRLKVVGEFVDKVPVYETVEIYHGTVVAAIVDGVFQIPYHALEPVQALLREVLIFRILHVHGKAVIPGVGLVAVLGIELPRGVPIGVEFYEIIGPDAGFFNFYLFSQPVVPLVDAVEVEFHEFSFRSPVDGCAARKLEGYVIAKQGPVHPVGKEHIAFAFSLSQEVGLVAELEGVGLLDVAPGGIAPAFDGKAVAEPEFSAVVHNLDGSALHPDILAVDSGGGVDVNASESGAEGGDRVFRLFRLLGFRRFGRVYRLRRVLLLFLLFGLGLRLLFFAAGIQKEPPCNAQGHHQIFLQSLQGLFNVGFVLDDLPGNKVLARDGGNGRGRCPALDLHPLFLAGKQMTEVVLAFHALHLDICVAVYGGHADVLDEHGHRLPFVNTEVPDTEAIAHGH